jgi:hypothetical protein
VVRPERAANRQEYHSRNQNGQAISFHFMLLIRIRHLSEYSMASNHGNYFLARRK